MSAPTVEQLLKGNEAHQLSHKPFPKFPDLPVPLKTVIISCADPRIHPESIFQLKLGEVVVFRNLGGHPHTAVKDIIALDAVIGFSNIIVVHHEDCGATYWTNDTVRGILKERNPDETGIDEMEFGAITTSLEQSVVDDLKILRSAPLLRQELKDKARGFLYSIQTGSLTEISQ